MVAAEIISGLGGLKAAFDLAKGLKDIDDATRRNAAVIELQEKILTAQQAQSSLVERVHELENKVAGFEAWDAEKKRYKLKDFGGGTFAYELQPEEARGEPTHRVCAACYQKRHLSILQFGFRGQSGDEHYDCPECKTRFRFGGRR